MIVIVQFHKSFQEGRASCQGRSRGFESLVPLSILGVITAGSPDGQPAEVGSEVREGTPRGTPEPLFSYAKVALSGFEQRCEDPSQHESA